MLKCIPRHGWTGVEYDDICGRFDEVQCGQVGAPACATLDNDWVWDGKKESIDKNCATLSPPSHGCNRPWMQKNCAKTCGTCPERCLWSSKAKTELAESSTLDTTGWVAIDQSTGQVTVGPVSNWLDHESSNGNVFLLCFEFMEKAGHAKHRGEGHVTLVVTDVNEGQLFLDASFTVFEDSRSGMLVGNAQGATDLDSLQTPPPRLQYQIVDGNRQNADAASVFAINADTAQLSVRHHGPTYTSLHATTSHNVHVSTSQRTHHYTSLRPQRTRHHGPTYTSLHATTSHNVHVTTSQRARTFQVADPS